MIHRRLGHSFLDFGQLAADALALRLHGALGTHAFADIGGAKRDLGTDCLIHFDLPPQWFSFLTYNQCVALAFLECILFLIKNNGDSVEEEW